MKYLKSIKPSTGQAKKNYKGWSWATHMERFKPFLAMAKTLTNVNPSGTEGNSEVSNSEFPSPEIGNDDRDQFSADTPMDQPELQQLNLSVESNCSTQPQAKKLKQQPTVSNVDKVVEYLQTKNKPPLDATDHLMLGYGKTIKSFSRKRQAEIKFKIAQLINQCELEQLEEDNLSTPCTSSLGSWYHSGHSFK